MERYLYKKCLIFSKILVIGGFGSGALFFTPSINALCEKFSTLPTFLGNRLH